MNTNNLLCATLCLAIIQQVNQRVTLGFRFGAITLSRKEPVHESMCENTMSLYTIEEAFEGTGSATAYLRELIYCYDSKRNVVTLVQLSHLV